MAGRPKHHVGNCTTKISAREPVNVLFETAPVDAGVMVVAPTFYTQNRVEFFCVEVEKIDLMSGGEKTR
jgi:hypothetical protein